MRKAMIEYRCANSRADAIYLAQAAVATGMSVINIQEELTTTDEGSVKLSGKWHFWAQGEKKHHVVVWNDEVSFDLDDIAGYFKEKDVAIIDESVGRENE